MKKKISAAGGAVLGAALLLLAFRGADARAVAALLRGLDPAIALLVFCTVLGELVLRGIKWRLLLAPAGRVRFWDAFRIETAGLALNNVLPLRLGEAVRTALGAEVFRIGAVPVLSSILAEKVLDLAALLLLAAAAAGTGALPAWLTPGAAGAWALALAGAGALLYAAAGRLPGARAFLAKALTGLRAFRSPAGAAGLLGLALLQWCLNALNYFWLGLSLLPAGIATPRFSMVLSFTGAAASSVPGMPGYFGGFELAVSALLEARGLGREAALAFALAAHLLSYLFITAAGVFFIYQLGGSLGGLWARFSGSAAGKRA